MYCCANNSRIVNAIYYNVTDNLPYNTLPTNTLTLDGFKQYYTKIAPLDTTRDNKILACLLQVLISFEKMTNYSIFNFEYNGYIDFIPKLQAIQINRKTLNTINSIQYKAFDFYKTSTLTTVPTTFLDDESNTLQTYSTSEHDNSYPIISFNKYYESPEILCDHNNVVVSFTLNPLVFTPDLSLAMYMHAARVYEGQCGMDSFTESIYHNYCTNQSYIDVI